MTAPMSKETERQAAATRWHEMQCCRKVLRVMGEF